MLFRCQRFYEIRNISLVTFRSVTTTEISKYIFSGTNKINEKASHSDSLLSAERQSSFLEVRGNAEAGNSLKQTPSGLCLKARARLSKQNMRETLFVS